MPKVLVIDDSMTVRLQVTRALRGAGFETVEACDGIDALERIEQHPDVALAICDVNMPRMSGLEFLEAVRHVAPEIPVVILTTAGQTTVIREAKALGAKAWMIKPSNAESILETARRLTVATPTAPAPNVTD